MNLCLHRVRLGGIFRDRQGFYERCADCGARVPRPQIYGSRIEREKTGIKRHGREEREEIRELEKLL